VYVFQVEGKFAELSEIKGSSARISHRLEETRQYLQVDRVFVGFIQLEVLGVMLDEYFVYVGN
tara:strand:- start:1553 stop:1741 length:189 start_codon:yes stop_codon:yes gene_type:complete